MASIEETRDQDQFEHHDDSGKRTVDPHTSEARADDVPDGTGQKRETKSKRFEDDEHSDENEDDQEDDDEAEEKDKKPVDKRKVAIFGGLAALIIITISVAWLLYASTYEDTDDAEINGHLNTIASRIEGTVTAVYVEDNHPVQAGQPLVELDPSDYKISYEESHAQLLQAEASAQSAHPDLAVTRISNRADRASDAANIANAVASVASAEHDVTTAQAKLEEARANYSKAQKDVERYTLLVANDEVSHQQFDQYTATAKAQQASVEANEASVRSAAAIVVQKRAMEVEQRARYDQAVANGPRQVEMKEADIKNRDAGVSLAQATLQKNQLNLNYTHISSPVGGIALLRSAEVGDRVTPGQRLLEIAQLDDLWVDANFKETQLRKIHPGQRVTIHVDSLKEDFDGTVEGMPAATGDKASLFPAENATGNFVKVVQRLPIRIRFRSQQRDLDRLRPGMSVEPKVHLD